MILSTINAAIHIANAASFVLLTPGQALLEYLSCSAIYSLAVWSNLWVLPAAWRYRTESLHRIRMGQAVVAGGGAAVLLATHPNLVGLAFAGLLLLDSYVFGSSAMLLESDSLKSQQIDLSRACMATLSIVLTMTLFHRSPAAYSLLLLGLTVVVTVTGVVTGWYRPPPLFWRNAELPHIARDIARAFSAMQLRALLGARLVEIGSLLVLSWLGQVGVTIAVKIGFAISSSVLANARRYPRAVLIASEAAMYTASLGGAIVVAMWVPAIVPATLKTLTVAGMLFAAPVIAVHFGLSMRGLEADRPDRPGPGCRRVTVVQAFDAHAGAQRVAAQLAAAFREHGMAVALWLGFGRSGFVSEARPTWRFATLEQPRWRKLAYPLWLVAANLAAFIPLLRGDRLWVNSVAALPSGGIFLLFAPRRLVIHLHETAIPKLVHRIVAWAARRGAQVLAVSYYHRQRLALDCGVLPNAVVGAKPAAATPRDRLVFIGTSRAMKGFPLFLAVAERLRDCGLEPHAFLAAGPKPPTPDDRVAAAAAGVAVTVGETRPDVLLSRAFLFLQLTDPVLWDETFSLVTAEAVAHGVPVGGGGAAVLAEVAGGALAFNLASRDPDSIAAAIRALLADPVRYANLVAACEHERERFSLVRFGTAAAAIVQAAHG